MDPPNLRVGFVCGTKRSAHLIGFSFAFSLGERSPPCSSLTFILPLDSQGPEFEQWIAFMSQYSLIYSRRESRVSTKGASNYRRGGDKVIQSRPLVGSLGLTLTVVIRRLMCQREPFLEATPFVLIANDGVYLLLANGSSANLLLASASKCMEL